MIQFKGQLTKHFTLDEYQVHQTETCSITREALEHADMLEEFRVWLRRSMIVTSWYRTVSYNKKVGGVSGSLHLTGCATDVSFPNLSKDKFIKYAKKWKEICEEYGVVGEAGLYSWGMHLGSHITYSKTFSHWDTRTGKQINRPFNI